MCSSVAIEISGEITCARRPWEILSLVSSKVQSDEETQVCLNFALLIKGPWPSGLMSLAPECLKEIILKTGKG